jgi:hypothetical protein
LHPPPDRAATEVAAVVGRSVAKDDEKTASEQLKSVDFIEETV